MKKDRIDTPALVVFVKNPTLGSVKTRLAAQVGPEKALEVYLALLQHTHAVTLGCGAEVRVYYSDFMPDVDLWDIGYASKHVQQGADLGERLSNALQETFSAGYTKAAVIGSDCPHLAAVHLQRAFAELDEADVVLGPAKDGGYYLIGMKKLHADLFTGKPWSSAQLFDATIDDLIRLGLTWFELPILADVDTVEDLERTLFSDLVSALH